MMLPPKVRRSTMAAQTLGSVNVFVQILTLTSTPEKAARLTLAQIRLDEAAADEAFLAGGAGDGGGAGVGLEWSAA